MGSDYQLIMRDSFGNINRVIDTYASLEYTRVVNTVGSLTLTLADQWDSKRNLSTFDVYSQIDNQIEVWRSVDGRTPQLVGETIWFNRQPQRSFSEDGTRLVKIHCVDALELLKRRPFLETGMLSTTGYTTLPADNIMKHLVTSCFRPTSGTLATTFDVGSRFTIQADLAQGPTVHGDVALNWTNLLDTLQSLAQQSANASAPVYLAFDVVYVGPNLLEFRTYATQRGNDHRAPTGGAGVVTLDPAAGNLSDIELDLDATEEINWGMALSWTTAQTGGRQTQIASDTARIGMSPYNLRGKTQWMPEDQSNQAVIDEAARIVREGRPHETFTGRIVQTPGSQFMRDYGFGDIITASYLTSQFNCRFDAFRVTVDTGPENIDAIVKNDPLLN